jgi:4-amino-4-deoxy-L-arabinose transferase-like glycosyltransferase
MKSYFHLYRWIIPILLLFFSLLLRLALISKGPYHVDCLTLAINAQQTLANHQLHYQFGTGYPLTVLTGSLFVGLTRLFALHDPVFAVNLMSVIFSSLSVLILYLLVENLFNSRAAFFSALLFSLHPIFLSLSVYGNSHTVSIFFLLCSLYALASSKQRFSQLLFALFFGLMGAARLQDMILIIAPISIFWIFWYKNAISNFGRRIFTLTLCISVAFLIAGLFHIPYLLNSTHLQYSSQFKIFWTIGLTKNFLGFFSPYLIRSFKIIGFSTTLSSMLIAWFGLTKMLKEKLPLAILVITWFSIPLMFYGNLMTSVPRFFLISIPPLCLAFGYGIDRLLCTRKFIMKLSLATICVLIILLPNVTNIFPILLFRHTHALLPDWAHYVKNHTEPNALIISGDDEAFFNYYGQRQTLGRPKNMGPYRKEDLNSFKEILDNHLAANIPIYITSTGLYTYDQSGAFSSYIKTHYQLEYRGQRISEDWHNGELFLEKVAESFFRIYEKENLNPSILTQLWANATLHNI